jgi:hypothetical protein
LKCLASYECNQFRNESVLIILTVEVAHIAVLIQSKLLKSSQRWVPRKLLSAK